MHNKDFFRGLFRFAPEGTGGSGSAGSSSTGNGGDNSGASGSNAGGSEATGGNNPPTIDYNRIQQMLDGTLKAKENTALKRYFEQQGLSPEQAQQAINDFKTQQAANTPDVNVLQAQLAQAQATAQQAAVESAATIAAVALGIDAKTIPYVLKMTDLSQVIGKDGKINNETLTNAINKVLEDVPALKPQAAGSTGFVQVGTSGNGGAGQSQNEQLAAIFGNKK